MGLEINKFFPAALTPRHYHEQSGQRKLGTKGSLWCLLAYRLATAQVPVREEDSNSSHSTPSPKLQLTGFLFPSSPSYITLPFQQCALSCSLLVRPLLSLHPLSSHLTLLSSLLYLFYLETPPLHGQVQSAGHDQSTSSLPALDSSKCLWLFSPLHP